MYSDISVRRLLKTFHNLIVLSKSKIRHKYDTVSRQQHVRIEGFGKPLDFVDFFFDFERFEIIKLRIMRLEFCVKFETKNGRTRWVVDSAFIRISLNMKTAKRKWQR